MIHLDLYLPYPPTANHCYKHTRSGVHYMTGEAKSYQEEIGWILARHRKPIEGPIFVSYVLFPPDRRKRDIANTEKILTDALVKGGLFKDDCLVSLMLMRRGPVVRGGRVLAHIGNGCVNTFIDGVFAVNIEHEARLLSPA